MRRRLRRLLADTTLSSVARTDFAAWCRELRNLAALDVLASGAADLRTALVALVHADRNGPAFEAREGEDIGTRVAASPPARALLQHIVGGWLSRIGGSR
jgi:hypothetical protein